MAYNSPIELLLSEMHTKVEEEILNAVQKVGVIVDKDELMKALAYDRKQYEEGLRDGYYQAMSKSGWISVKDRLPENETEVIIIVQHRIGWYRAFAWHDAYGWHSIAVEFCDGDSDLVTHWMPLPEPPKGADQ